MHGAETPPVPSIVVSPVSDEVVSPRQSIFVKVVLMAEQVRATMFLPSTDSTSESALLQSTLGNWKLSVDYRMPNDFIVRTELDELIVLDQDKHTMYSTILGPLEEGTTIFIRLDVTTAPTMRSRIDMKVTPFKAVYCQEFFESVQISQNEMTLLLH